AGGAGGRKRNRRSLGAERFGQVAGDRAEHEAVVIFGEPSAAGDAQYVLVAKFGHSARAADLQPLWPFHFDRRDRKKHRSREIALATDGRLFESFLGRDLSEAFGQGGRRV